jgi:hypothetical protein
MPKPNDFGFRPNAAVIGSDPKEAMASGPVRKPDVTITLDAESAALIAEYMMQGYRKTGLAIAVSASTAG